MRVSHGTRINIIDDRNGYGYATNKMIESLESVGHEVNQNDKTADVEIWFDQPQHWKFSEGPYKIGYHPWESTLLQDGWAEIMNQCDEIWTPSPIIADWYTRYAGIKVPVYVYEHGVDPVWKPSRRKVDGTFKFFHVGGEAARKGVSETMRAFRMAFQKTPDVELNLKIISDGWKIGKLGRINVINKAVSVRDLVQMYHDNHVFVYPSYGEGFGLTPLQAMATGMPTITVPGWAPYAQFLNPELSLSSEFVKTPFPRFHPGAMLKPNFDELIDRLRFSYENYDYLEADAHARVADITAYYDWDRLTKKVFDDLQKRLENR